MTTHAVGQLKMLGNQGYIQNFPCIVMYYGLFMPAARPNNASSFTPESDRQYSSLADSTLATFFPARVTGSVRTRVIR